MKKYYLLFVFYSLCFNTQSQITQVNDSLMYGGRIKTFAKNTSCVLVGNEGGLFRTTNQGQSWTNVSQTFDPYSVSCNQIVSIGSNFYAMSSSYKGSNIFKSTNNGDLWTTLSFPSWSPMTIGKLSNMLFVVGSDWSTGEGRLYASSDGNTWIPKAIIWTNYWQGGNIQLLSFNQGKLYLLNNNDLYYTTDGNSLTAISTAGLSSPNFSKGDNNIAGDALGNLFFRSGNMIYKYNFTTESWSDIVSGKIPTDYQIMNMSVTDNAVFFAAMPSAEPMKMYKSTDQGGVFTELTSTGVSLAMIENIIEVGDNTFIGNDLYDGILLTSDGGSSWNSNTNQFTATFAGCVTHSGNSLLYNRGSRGLILSNNTGSNWAQANVGIPSFGNGIAYFINQLTQVKDTLFSFTRPDPFSDDVVLYKSSDFGNSWASSLIPAPYNTGKDYTFAGKCDSLLFVNYYNSSNSNYALIVSSTYGRSWTKPSSQNNSGPIFLKGSKSCLFAFFGSSNNYDDFNNIHKTNSFGLSFSDLNTNVNDQAVIKRVYNENGDKAGPMMDFDTQNNKAIFVVKDQQSGNMDKLFAFDINSTNWSEINTFNLPYNYIANCIKNIGNNTWLLATNFGLYKSMNGGNSWSITHSPDNWQNGMTVNSIEILGTKVILGTLSDGIWIVDLSVPFKLPNTQSAAFDGNQDRIRVLDNNPLNPSANPTAYHITGKAITVEAWIYPMSLPQKSDAGSIISRPYLTPSYREPWRSFELRIDNFWSGNDDPRIQWIISDGNVPGNWGATLDPNTPIVGAWTHVAGTYDGAKLRLYINGNLVNESNYSSDIGQGEVGLYIGGMTSQFFNGLIDEVRLWNVVKTQSEIQSNMNTTLVGNETGLVGYWPMDEEYIASNGALVTVDKTSNHNDMPIQFDTKLLSFPEGSSVLIPPTNISLSSYYAITGLKYRSKIATNGWPTPTITLLDNPTGLTMVGDSLFWIPQYSQYYGGMVSLKVSNESGTIKSDFHIDSESILAADNQIHLDVSNRGKFGASGNYNKGLFYKSLNGLYSGDFSLIDRDNNKFDGGLYCSTPFAPMDGFSTITSRFPGFTAFKTSFNDVWEPNKINVSIDQAVHSSITSGNDKYAIVEYRVTNNSGGDLGDLFAQMTTDFDVGVYNNDLTGYDATTQASYAYESGGATNPYYYGFSLLNGTVSGATFFNVDSIYVRKIMPLTTFTQNPTTPNEFRNQISTGPFNLSNGESRTFAFAIFAGDNLNDIKNSALNAKQVFVANPINAIDEVNMDHSSGFRLEQNYPNPFQSTTQIAYSVGKAGKVSLKVYDLGGKLMNSMVNEIKAEGNYTVRFNAKDIPSGVYYYQLESENYICTKKLVLIK